MAHHLPADVIHWVCLFLPLNVRPETLCAAWWRALRSRRVAYRCVPPRASDIMPALLSHMMRYAGAAAYVSVTLDGIDHDLALVAAGVLSFTPLHRARHVRFAAARLWRGNTLQRSEADCLLRILSSAPELEHMELCLPFHNLDGAAAGKELAKLLSTAKWPRLCRFSLVVNPANGRDCAAASELIATATQHVRTVVLATHTEGLIQLLATDIQLQALRRGEPRCDRLRLDLRTGFPCHVARILDTVRNLPSRIEVELIVRERDLGQYATSAPRCRVTVATHPSPSFL